MEPDQPDLQLLTAEQLKYQLHQARAPLTLVHIWATWCSPCREEFPILMRFRDDYNKRGVTLLLVSADSPAEKDAVTRYLADHNARFTSYLIDNPNETFVDTLNPQWSGAIPASFFFGPGGELRQWWEGKAEHEKYRATAESLLKAGN